MKLIISTLSVRNSLAAEAYGGSSGGPLMERTLFIASEDRNSLVGD